MTAVTLAPITLEDVGRVSEFFRAHLNERVPASAWRALLDPPWPSESAPNRGFQLLEGDTVVGAYAAVYSTRRIATEDVRVCNMAAFCVREEHRAHSLRLLRAILAQKGYIFTDLSPSGNVPAMNERLGFRRVEAATRAVVNLPRPRGRGVSVTADPAGISSTLQGVDLEVYRDHHDAPAARHLVVRSGGRHAYLMYRRDRRKGIPVFATPLYVGGDPAVLADAWPSVAAHLLRQGLAVTLAESRILGFVPRGPGRVLANPRPRMFRGDVDPRRVDYLYSELTLVEW